MLVSQGQTLCYSSSSIDTVEPLYHWDMETVSANQWVQSSDMGLGNWGFASQLMYMYSNMWP